MTNKSERYAVRVDPETPYLMRALSEVLDIGQGDLVQEMVQSKAETLSDEQLDRVNKLVLVLKKEAAVRQEKRALLAA